MREGEGEGGIKRAHGMFEERGDLNPIFLVKHYLKVREYIPDKGHTNVKYVEKYFLEVVI